MTQRQRRGLALLIVGVVYGGVFASYDGWLAVGLSACFAVLAAVGYFVFTVDDPKGEPCNQTQTH